MLKILKCSFAAIALTAAFSLPAAEQSAQTVRDTGSNKQQPVTAQAINNQTAVACNLCFTCGGDWPVFAGSFTPGGTSNQVTERGAACSGASITRSDSRPFMCCR
jgi:hypothetical protein